MSPIAIGLIAFSCLFLGALAGMFLRSTLPGHHLSADSKDSVKFGTGLIGTMAALLLGLLVASAKSSFDTKNDELTQMAAKIGFLDRVLAHYGPEASEARQMLRHFVAGAVERIWPTERSETAQLDPAASSGEMFYDSLHKLSPHNDEQTTLKSQALSLVTDIGQTRWLLLAQQGSTISTPMLVVVIFWLTIVFVSFGLFAPANVTVVATQLLCALSIAGAIFLVLELDRPFGGMIHISSAPMQSALEHLGK
jgi:hypothetical protein